MRLNSSIKMCPIATVTNGWVQATLKGVVYVEYLPKAKDMTFAVNARSFIDALETLKEDYTIIINKEDEIVNIFDDTQDFNLDFQRPEIPVKRPVDGWLKGNISSPWMILNNFASAQFPAIRVTKDYFEAMTTESIVRIEHDFADVVERNVVICKIPKKSEFYNFNTPLFLWLGYSKTCFIALKYLGIELPNTDQFFETWETGSLIPKYVLPKLTLAETASFTKRGLKLHIEDVSDVYIEGVEGEGRYSYPLFKKYLANGISWFFDGQLLKVTGNKIKMILENLDAK